MGQQEMDWSKKEVRQVPERDVGQKEVRVGHEPPRVMHSWAPEKAEGGVEAGEMSVTCRHCAAINGKQSARC
jgi:hypothetical protein